MQWSKGLGLVYSNSPRLLVSDTHSIWLWISSPYFDKELSYIRWCIIEHISGDAGQYTASKFNLRVREKYFTQRWGNLELVVVSYSASPSNLFSLKFLANKGALLRNCFTTACRPMMGKAEVLFERLNSICIHLRYTIHYQLVNKDCKLHRIPLPSKHLWWWM